MTTKQVQRVIELYQAGTPGPKISKDLGVCTRSVYCTLKAAGVQIRPRSPIYRQHRYVIYTATGEFVCQGTVRECAGYLGVKPASIYKMVSRPPKKLRIYVEPMGGTDDGQA